MSEDKVFNIGDMVKTTEEYNKRFGKEHKGLIIDTIDMSSVDNFPISHCFCAEITAKNKLEYINFEWLELVE